jgi:heat shock protein HslJ
MANRTGFELLAAITVAGALCVAAACSMRPAMPAAEVPTTMPTSPAFDAATLAGSTWVAEDIDHRGVIDYLQSRLQFVGTDRVAGFGGCNVFNGSAELSANRLRFGPLAATKKLCPPAIMDQEDRFFKALGRVRSARTENGLLYLLDETGSDILRFWRVE